MTSSGATPSEADKLCIDLCCGLGGFSQAFVNAGWEVVTVDIAPEFSPSLIADIRELSAEHIRRASEKGAFCRYEKVVIIASPPCQRFSIANSNWPQKGIRQALDIVGACIELIADIKPDYWVLENPKGRLRWFLGAPPHSVKLSDYGHTESTQGGKWRKAYKPTDLWGNVIFKLLDKQIEMLATKGQTGFTKESRAKRALMPLGLSQAILEAVEQP